MNKIKAVIMAGGEGTRLHPITDDMPKPLVPILNIPTMSRILMLLSENKIMSAAVTTHYLSGKISDYYKNHDTYGVTLSFFEEPKPLGTAGSVKNAESFLDSDFIVISGDAVCDFSLDEAVKFHYENEALATMVLARRDVPTEFGVVICDEKQKIRYFSEKPSWKYVTADTVNTGIYIFGKKILDMIPKDTFYDFSNDLFPRLVGEGLFGYVADGYWCDIGNIDAYYKCNMDAIEGKIRSIKPHKKSVLGDGCEISRGASVCGYSVVGNNVKIGDGTIIESSIIMDNAEIGEGCTVRSSIICGHTRIADDATIPQGCVIGGGSAVDKNVMLAEKTKVAANMTVTRDDIMLEGAIFSGDTGSLLREFGAVGDFSTGLSPQFLVKYGASICKLKSSPQIIFFDDGKKSSGLISDFLISGARMCGAECTQGGDGFSQLCSFAAPYGGYDFGVCVKNVKDTLYRIYLFDKYGFAPGRSSMRKIISAMQKPLSIPAEKIVRTKEPKFDFRERYAGFLLSSLKRLDGLKLSVDDGTVSVFLGEIAKKLGASVVISGENKVPEDYVFVSAADENLKISYKTGESLNIIDKWHAMAAAIKGKAEAGEKEIFLPDDAPSALYRISEKAGVKAKKCSDNPAAAAGQVWHNDTVMIALLFLGDLQIQKVFEPTESFATISDTVSVGGSASVLGSLVRHGAKESDNGIVMEYDSGFVRINAEDAKTLRLTSEAATEEKAKDYIDYTKSGVFNMVDEGK